MITNTTFVSDIPVQPTHTPGTGIPIFELVFNPEGHPQIIVNENSDTYPDSRIVHISSATIKKISERYPSNPDQILTEDQFQFLKTIVFGTRASVANSCVGYAYSAQKMAEEVFHIHLTCAMVLKESTPFSLRSEMKKDPRAETKPGKKWSNHCFLLGAETEPCGKRRLCIVDLTLTHLVRVPDWQHWMQCMWPPEECPKTVYFPHNLESLYTLYHLDGNWAATHLLTSPKALAIQSAASWLTHSYPLDAPSFSGRYPQDACLNPDLPSVARTWDAILKTEGGIRYAKLSLLSLRDSL